MRERTTSSKSENGTPSSSGWCAIKLHRDCGRSGRYISKLHSQCRAEIRMPLAISIRLRCSSQHQENPFCSLPLAIQRLLCWEAALVRDSFSLPNERCQICRDHTDERKLIYL